MANASKSGFLVQLFARRISNMSCGREAKGKWMKKRSERFDLRRWGNERKMTHHQHCYSTDVVDDSLSSTSSPSISQSTANTSFSSSIIPEPSSIADNLMESRSWMNTGLQEQIEQGERRISKAQDTQFTVMSFNVLSDHLMKMHRDLYRNAAEDDLKWEKRFPRIIAEVRSRNPDILALQEVHHKHYETHFKPELEKLGYRGVYKKRTGDKEDGCAIFHKSKFILEESVSVEYHQPGVGCLDRDNIGLLVRLGSVKGANKERSASKNKLVVANTHLLYNPNRQDVKLAQTALLLAELDRFCTDHRASGQFIRRLPCIVTGDFNFTPDSPVFQFVTRGFFSFQGLDNRQLTPHGNRGFKLGDRLLPDSLGVTENCQHVELEQHRAFYRPTSEEQTHHRDHFQTSPVAATSFLRHSERDEHRESQRELLHSGSLRHNFGLRSSYKLPDGGKTCTTKQDGWVVVDYIFYSTVHSAKFGRNVEGNLKLLSKLALPRVRECQRIGGMPSKNAGAPSDHFPVMAKFLLKGDF